MFPTSILRSLEQYNPYDLADLIGDILPPDDWTSPGALFLTSVRDAVCEVVDEVDDDDIADLAETMNDFLHVLADAAVPVGTFERWTVWTDLGGWQYAPALTDLGTTEVDVENLTDNLAASVLYLVARDVASALVSDAADQIGDAIDTLTERATNLGDENGADAAGWFTQETVGGRTTGDVSDVAREILAGIAEGDPLVADALPRADLSGQSADGTTVTDLLSGRDGLLSGLSTDCEVAQNLADVYETAFSEAVEREVVAACDAVLSDD